MVINVPAPEGCVGRCRSSREQKSERLLVELMAVPVEEQHAGLAESRFQNPLLFELLVEAGRARLLDDPCRAVRHLALAMRLAARLYEGHPVSREIEGEGLSRALCLAGTACRF